MNDIIKDLMKKKVCVDNLQIRHFEHAWLKESWATYMEALWLEDSLGQDEFLYQVKSK
jgi:aminopeptidase N